MRFCFLQDVFTTKRTADSSMQLNEVFVLFILSLSRRKFHPEEILSRRNLHPRSEQSPLKEILNKETQAPNANVQWLEFLLTTLIVIALVELMRRALIRLDQHIHPEPARVRAPVQIRIIHVDPEDLE
ncbi:hypothetical protein BDV25DRAFT_166488 [Aspergillus avenaceus]|uniref:Uncharacterized protein n=1 Tax=Aspergillus avenaceus TaxID=36643 RepID=A0A5N6TDZ2_ASPAV|nr:hypothetical protein BDV25DRAFT_166488 [Aspergillus avenaceus]